MSEQNKILFRETQHLLAEWLIYGLAGLILLTNFIVIYAFRGFNLDLDLVFFLITPLIPFIFYFVKMNTEIDEQGININYSHFYKRKILFNEIAEAYVRKYRPIIEYGGWGLKGWKKSNRAYNIRGDKGLQLELLNSDRVLIGTQKPEELAKIIENIKNKEQ